VHVLRDLRELGARVTVLARSEATRERALAGGAARVVASLDDAGRGLDGVVVVTPADHHAAAILEVAPLGCPIFCEKPLTVDLDERDAILAACGERLSVMHKWRWHPGVERLAALAAEGAVGEVTGVRATRLGGGDAHVGADSLDTLAAHDLSIGLAVLGRLPAVRAAHGTRWPGDPSVGWVEATAILAEAGGPGVVIDVSAVGAERVRRVEVTGTRGSAVLPGPEAPAVLLRRHAGAVDGDARVEALPVDPEWPLRRELRDFLDHCRGGPQPRATATEGFAVVERILDIRAELERTA
jgi:predicted dehydrogenase